MANPIRDWVVFGILIATIGFLNINFDADYGRIFGYLVLGGAVLYILDIVIKTSSEATAFTLRFERDPNNRLNSLLVSGVTYIIFLLIAGVIMTTLKPGLANPVQAVYSVFATNVPVLAESPVAKLFAFGLPVPIVENMIFFQIFPEFASDAFGLSLDFNIKSPTFWLIVLFFGGLFGYYHLTARKFDQVGLIVTTLFGIYMMLLTLWFKESKQGAVVHAYHNTASIAKQSGIFGLEKLAVFA